MGVRHGRVNGHCIRLRVCIHARMLLIGVMWMRIGDELVRVDGGVGD